MVPDTPPDRGMGAGLIQEEEEEWDRPPLITTIHNAIKPGREDDSECRRKIRRRGRGNGT
jgi:hypothetical protein